MNTNPPSPHTTVYTPRSQMLNFGSVLRGMGSGALRGRHLALRLFKRDLRAEFSDALLGYFWNFVNPLILAVIFLLMRKGGVLSADGIDMPFGLYVTAGMLLFQTFTQALNYPMGLLRRSQGLITQVKVPPEALLGSLLLRLLFDGLFYMLIFTCVLLYTGLFSWANTAVMLATYPAMILLGASIGIFLAPFNAIFTDFEKLTQNLTRPLLFLTPTFYRSYESMPLLHTLTEYNPIAIVMNNVRAYAATGQWHSPEAFAITVCASAVLLLLGWLLFHVAVPVVSDKL